VISEPRDFGVAPFHILGIGSDCSCRYRSGKTGKGDAVKDYLAQLEKLRSEAAECALIRDLATDKTKREMFDRLCSHLTLLADQIELAMIERKNGTK
jgi:hypothetical protein